METKQILEKLNTLYELKEDNSQAIVDAKNYLDNIYQKPATHQFLYLINHYKKLIMLSRRRIKKIDSKFNELKKLL